MKKKAKSFVERILKIIGKPEMRILPGQLAFFFVLSLIPLIAMIGGIASLFSISMESIEELITSSFPKDAANVLLPIISGKGLNVNMVIFFISAFFLASNGTHSMIIASNTIYKVKDKDYITRRIKAILMTFILVSLLVFVLLVPAFGDLIVKGISYFIESSHVTKTIHVVYQICKYPVSLLLIYFNIKLLYTIAPDTKIKSETTTYGALFTTVTWIIVTEIYSIYVEVFTKYDLFYGSISNILILLLWVYILSYIFVMGMALNAASVNKEDPIKQR